MPNKEQIGRIMYNFTQRLQHTSGISKTRGGITHLTQEQYTPMKSHTRYLIT